MSHATQNLGNMNKQYAMGPDGLLKPMDVNEARQMQQQGLIVQTAVQIMAQLTSVTYINALNDAKNQKMQNIRNQLEEEEFPFDRDAEAVKRYNADPNMQFQLNLEMPADVAIQAAVVLVKKLGL